MMLLPSEQILTPTFPAALHNWILKFHARQSTLHCINLFLYQRMLEIQIQAVMFLTYLSVFTSSTL